ncbi:MAG: FAD-binding protein [Rubripirellula sp.]
MNEPQNDSEIQSLIKDSAQVLAVGNQTKPPLCAVENATLVSLRKLTGIIEYEPSEFTFTARAGTPVSEIAAALAEKNQYLPFDPMLVASGATLGGTVASGLAGPGRFRYGGVRDFLLGVKFVAGDGAVINAGGKVVKNAAGFDIPKFLVGSLGRLGVMTEMTFKVFPLPIAARTLQLQCSSHQQAMERMSIAAASRWELDAIDYRPRQSIVAIRLRGPQVANDALATDIQSKWGNDVSDFDAADSWWASIIGLDWEPEHRVAIKVACTPQQCATLTDSLPDSAVVHWSVAGNVLWILAKDEASLPQIEASLIASKLPALVVRGSTQKPCIGAWPDREINGLVKSAMDPASKFPCAESKAS